MIDGEAVLLGVDGRSDFNDLHSRKHDGEVEFYAFDMLVSDGEDLRKLPLSMRKTNLARLLARRVDGIHLAPFEQGEIGPDLFRHACLMGLEGLVSKHRESPYRGGRGQGQEPAASGVQPGDGCVLIVMDGCRVLWLESVRRDHAGLHSFLSMILIEARRRNASAFRLRFSQSLARRLHRPSHANVRSTTHRFGRTTNPFA